MNSRYEHGATQYVGEYCVRRRGNIVWEVATHSTQDPRAAVQGVRNVGLGLRKDVLKRLRVRETFGNEEVWTYSVTGNVFTYRFNQIPPTCSCRGSGMRRVGNKYFRHHFCCPLSVFEAYYYAVNMDIVSLDYDNLHAAIGLWCDRAVTERSGSQELRRLLEYSLRVQDWIREVSFDVSRLTYNDFIKELERDPGVMAYFG